MHEWFQSHQHTWSPTTTVEESLFLSPNVLIERVDLAAFSRVWLIFLCYAMLLFWERNKNNVKPLGHLPVAPALAPASVRSSLSRSAWAPAPPPQICSQPPLSRGLTPQCGLPPSLSIPLSSFIFLLILSTCTQAYFPYCLSPTVERNSRRSVSSWLNSLFSEQWLMYSQSSINTCWNG